MYNKYIFFLYITFLNLQHYFLSIIMKSHILIGKKYSNADDFEKAVTDFATANGFGVFRKSGNPNNIYMKCNQSITYTDKIDPQKRKRNGKTTKTAVVPCGWKAFASKTKGSDGFVCSYVVPHEMAGSKKIYADTLTQIDLDTVVEHSHEMISNEIVTAKMFPSARRLDEETHEEVMGMVRHGFGTKKICSYMEEERNVVILEKDISNLKANVGNGKTREERLVEQIQLKRDEGFIVHMNKDDNNVLRLALIIHPDAPNMIKRYGEVLTTDSTYMTNSLHLPLLNIVGFTNLGQHFLQTFIAASAIMISEAAKNYTWIFNTFKEAIWNQQPYNTKVNSLIIKK